MMCFFSGQTVKPGKFRISEKINIFFSKVRWSTSNIKNNHHQNIGAFFFLGFPPISGAPRWDRGTSGTSQLLPRGFLDPPRHNINGLVDLERVEVLGFFLANTKSRLLGFFLKGKKNSSGGIFFLEKFSSSGFFGIFEATSSLRRLFRTEN